jgi:inosine-uridine nucleoside N-ribohydrolase
MATRIILDTDIGTDVDDCLALALVLGSPELRLEAVTCVYGDVALRAQMVLKLLRLAGRPEVPVALGAGAPLLGRVPVYWAGHEGVGLLAADEGPGGGAAVPHTDEPAHHLIARTALAAPGEIHLVAIGPLTNVALAFLSEPRLAGSLAGLTVMGGAVRGLGGPESLGLALAEHNIKCDPEAAQIVFGAGARLNVVPLDVTTRVRVAAGAPERIAGGSGGARGGDFRAAVARQLALYPPFVRRGWTHVHDPLAVATVVDPGLVTRRPLRLDVELESRLAAGATLARLPTAALPANAGVAVDVDAPRFEGWLLERLCASPGGTVRV